MIKIFQVFSGVLKKNGGIQRHCDDLCSLFQFDKDFSMTIISNKMVRKLPFIRKNYFCHLYETIKLLDCNIVHIHGFAELSVVQAIITAKILRKKIVYSPHFHPIQYLQHPMLGKLFFACLLRPVLRFVSTIVTISEIDTKFFKKYHANVISIPHYYEGKSLQQSHTINKKKNMILFVGRNEENKGIELLYKLPSKYEVHCVTQGILLRKDFIQHCSISDQELDLLYKEASLVVIPSRYEAFSYVALEAFAHGTPVVMSDRVQIASYLNGRVGYSIFKYADYPSFLNAIEKTIGMKVDVKGIMALFNKQKVKEMYISMYRQVLVHE